MGDYKRLISYIYSYERGTKSKNAGFAKIESRNGICKVNISLRIADELMNEAEDNMLEVFFFYRDNGEVKKVFLERIRIVNGCSMIKMRMNSDNIGNVGIAIDRITGIFICTRAFLNEVHNLNIVYASEWDDIPIEVNKFKEKSNDDINIQNSTEAELKIAEGSLDSDTYDIKGEALENNINLYRNAVVETDAESQLVSVLNSNSGTEIEPEVKGEIKSEIKSEMETNAEPEPEIENDTKSEIETNEEPGTEIEPETNFADDRKKCNNKLADMLKEGPKNDEIDDTGNADSVAGDYFRMLCNCYPKIRVNEINGECIKITPHDISYLPKKYWHLCNNSFLLHGFYNYKYLLLCEKKMDSGKKYLVGVPGMFHQKEQVIARMFGFTEFECNNATNRYGNKAMKFGYWCMYL
jgi:hypothetical protein